MSAVLTNGRLSRLFRRYRSPRPASAVATWSVVAARPFRVFALSGFD
jgi:hypothetical protein